MTSTLEPSTNLLFPCYSNNHMKANADKCHLLITTILCERNPVSKKSSKVRQNLKTLISVLEYIFSASAKTLFFREGMSIKLCSLQFWDFLNISLFPKIQCLKGIVLLLSSLNFI